MSELPHQNLLACPKCHGPLQNEGDALVCPKCAQRFPLRSGIPMFLPASFAARFTEAQAAEEAHHEEAWTRMDMGPLSYVKSIPEYRDWLESFYRVGFYAFGFSAGWLRDKTVLEIGSGPFGMLAALPHGAGVAVDPLMPSFAPYMAATWAPSPLRIASLGEELPVADGTFDVAVAINCLDHTLQPQLILKELARTLKPGGLFFLMNNVKSTAGVMLSRIGERLGIKKLTEVFHPHAFSRRGLAANCRAAGFQVLQDYIASWSLTAEQRAKCSRLNLLRRRVENERALWLLAQKPA